MLAVLSDTAGHEDVGDAGLHANGRNAPEGRHCAHAPKRAVPRDRLCASIMFIEFHIDPSDFKLGTYLL